MQHSPEPSSARTPRPSGPLWRRGDRGASVVDAAAAMVIAVIILLGLATTLSSGLRHLQENRLQEQATQLAIERLEYARSLPYSQVGVDPAVADTDPHVFSAQRFLRGETFGLPGNEDLIEKSYGSPDAAIPYLRSVTLGGVTFTARSYVSLIRPGLRRVIVCVGWSTGRGDAREVVMSTTISEVSTS